MSMEPIRHTNQRPIDDEELELMDPDSWDWDRTEIGKTAGAPGAIIEVRFTRDEILALSRLAKQTGVGTVEYTR